MINVFFVLSILSLNFNFNLITIFIYLEARKTLPHQQLVGEVFSQLIFFKPEGKDIKKRIEALIEREYLDREKDQPNVYVYLA